MVEPADSRNGVGGCQLPGAAAAGGRGHAWPGPRRARYGAAMRRVALFARRPVVGRVKTRLSPALPPEMACMLYEGMLADAVAAVRGSRLADERFVYWAEAGSAGDAGGLPERVQVGGDLGERLIVAFDELIATPGDHAVIIGADCPMLDAAVIDEAFSRLKRAEVVIAPASDGGYALIGLARRAPELFRGIAWGTEHVLEVTLEGARTGAGSVSLLSQLEDVDTSEDLVRLLPSLIVQQPELAASTMGALVRCGLLADE